MKNTIDSEYLIHHLHKWGVDNIIVYTATTELLKNLGYTISDTSTNTKSQNAS